MVQPEEFWLLKTHLFYKGEETLDYYGLSVAKSTHILEQLSNGAVPKHNTMDTGRNWLFKKYWLKSRRIGLPKAFSLLNTDLPGT